MKQTGPLLTLALKANATRRTLSISAPRVGAECFYFVWSPQRSAPRKRHDTKEAAITEAERLAVLNPDCSYNVYSARRIATRRGTPASTE